MPIRSTAMVPSMATKTLICIDKVEDDEFGGTLCNPYMEKIVEFWGVKEFLCTMESFFNDIAFPQAHYTSRTFSEKSTQEKKQWCKPKTIIRHLPDDILTGRGRIASFVVHVESRRNATWQGSLEWKEKEKFREFFSVRELLYLMEAAFSQVVDYPVFKKWDD